MAKLYPPYIDNVLPAFTENLIVVPFQLNRAVNRSDFKKLSIIIKTVSTGAVKCSGGLSTQTIQYNGEKGYFEAKFEPYNIGFVPQVGQFYKIQVAFCEANNDSNVGYYSTVGVAKCTAKPEVIIEGLKQTSTVNQNITQYVGKYQQTGDTTERVYSYRFDVYDRNNTLVETSGEQLHNSSTDTDPTSSTDTWILEKNLTMGEEYIIYYRVKTLNGYECSSMGYVIMEMDSKDLDHLYLNLLADLKPNDGYVQIYLKSTFIGDVKPSIKGHFVLARASSENDFQSWNEIYRFDLVNESGDGKHLWNDFSVKQGEKYRYCIQAYNENSVYSNRLYSKSLSVDGTYGDESIYVDFEDCFLFDGEKQLRIRYNPKVSSFKRTVLETKVDTLGGKHPFIFRNGRVDYKEFQISGLLSYISDSLGFFGSGVLAAGVNEEDRIERGDSADIPDGSQTDLTAENYRKEREFKLQALEWLSNGKPKLFRSAAEGNYIVRLMNVSLSPVDAVGRMIHNFSCTAYEIAECNFANLEAYGFIRGKQLAAAEIKIVELTQSQFNFNEDNQLSLSGPALYLRFENFYSGDEALFVFHYSDGTQSESFDVANTTNQYYAAGELPITGLTYLSDVENIPYDARITYGYYEPSLTSDFAHITNIEIEDKIEQYYGHTTSANSKTVDILSLLEDGVRVETGRFHYIGINLRPTAKVWQGEDENWYSDFQCKQKVTFNSSIIYLPQNVEGRYLDGGILKFGNINYTAYINNNDYSNLEKHDIETGEAIQVAGRFEGISNLESVNRLEIGDGLVANIVYQSKTITYSIEDEEPVRDTKQAWLGEKSVYEHYLLTLGADSIETKNAKSEMDQAYSYYIETLEEALRGETGEVIYAI